MAVPTLAGPMTLEELRKHVTTTPDFVKLQAEEYQKAADAARWATYPTVTIVNTSSGYTSEPMGIPAGVYAGYTGAAGGGISTTIYQTEYSPEAPASSAWVVVDPEEVAAKDRLIEELKSQLAERDEIIWALSGSAEEADDLAIEVDKLREENARLRIVRALEHKPAILPLENLPGKDGWIEWCGAVRSNTFADGCLFGFCMPEYLAGKSVTVRLRGHSPSGVYEPAERFRWNDTGSDSDIIAYKVAK
jgi:hypothetical protein